MEHRIKELDYLKSIFILLMIVFHLVYIGDKYPYIKQIVYTFHMSAFLIISGYLDNVQKDIKSFVRKLFCSIHVHGGRLRNYVTYLTGQGKYTRSYSNYIITQDIYKTIRSLLVSSHLDYLQSPTLSGLPLYSHENNITVDIAWPWFICYRILGWTHSICQCHLFPCRNHYQTK